VHGFCVEPNLNLTILKNQNGAVCVGGPQQKYEWQGSENGRVG